MFQAKSIAGSTGPCSALSVSHCSGSGGICGLGACSRRHSPLKGAILSGSHSEIRPRTTALMPTMPVAVGEGVSAKPQGSLYKACCMRARTSKPPRMEVEHLLLETSVGCQAFDASIGAAGSHEGAKGPYFNFHNSLLGISFFSKGTRRGAGSARLDPPVPRTVQTSWLYWRHQFVEGSGQRLAV